MGLAYDAVPVVTVAVDVVVLHEYKYIVYVDGRNPAHMALVTVLVVIDRKEEQKEVALFDLRASTILTTLEHCAGVRFLAARSRSSIGEENAS